MSLLLSGPRRVYLLQVFWDRLADPCRSCSLARAHDALGPGAPELAERRCPAPCRVILAFSACRLLWRRIVGLRVLVVEPAA
jgi:hypothetical protein